MKPQLPSNLWGAVEHQAKALGFWIPRSISYRLQAREGTSKAIPVLKGSSVNWVTLGTTGWKAFSSLLHGWVRLMGKGTPGLWMGTNGVCYKNVYTGAELEKEILFSIPSSILIFT